MTKSQSLQKKAFITPCPECGAFVQLPQVVPIDAEVRCPKCVRIFALASILPDELPVLEIVEGGGKRSDRSIQSDDTVVDLGPVEADSLDTIKIDGKLEVPSALRNGAKRRRHSHSAAASTPPVTSSAVADVEVTESRPSGASTSRRSSRSDSRRHHRRTHANRPVSEAFKIALGAILALPVAQLIIWWGFGLDPLGIGPSVGQVVPLAVPASLRERDTENLDSLAD